MPNPVVRYTDNEKFQAVALYVSLGNLTATSKELNIPYDTIKDWKGKPWWKQYERNIKSEENAALSAKFRKIVNKVQDQIFDRLKDGDHYVLRDGSVIRVPIKARELAVVGAIAIDKVVDLDSLQENREEIVSIEQRLNLLAKELVEMVKGKKPKHETIDVLEVTNGLQETQSGETQTKEVSA